MASISFDKSVGWWKIKYYASPDQPRVVKPLCKHPGSWSKSKPPKTKPAIVLDLARPYQDIERLAKAGILTASVDIPLAKHIADYIAHFARTKQPNSAEALKHATNKFLAYCRKKKIGTLQGVTRAVCTGWIVAQAELGFAATTTQTDRGYIARIFTKAEEQGLIRENPWRFAKVDVPKTEKPPKFWTTDELQKLFAVLDRWIHDWVVLDANTGLRVSALLGLKWRDISFPDNRLIVPAHLSKSGKSYSVPLTPTANSVLARRWSETTSNGPDDWIFLNPARGKPYVRSTTFQSIGRAVKKAGIRDFGTYCHALRHSFAVAMVSKGVPIRDIQSHLGHLSITTTEIYAKFAPGAAEGIRNSFDINPSAEPERPSVDPGTSSPRAKRRT